MPSFEAAATPTANSDDPRPRYANTRHNIGALVTAGLTKRLAPDWESRIALATRGARARLLAQGRLSGDPAVDDYPVINLRVTATSRGRVPGRRSAKR